MNCDELRDHYELYAMGLAEEPESGEIRAHLGRDCPTCVPGVRRARELMRSFCWLHQAAQTTWIFWMKHSIQKRQAP